jgi:hypothetical protein
MVPIPPGLLQYRVKKETIIGLCAEIKNLKKNNADYKKNFELDCHTPENFLRLVPSTQLGVANKDNWRILLVLKSADGADICLKGALLNIATGEIALISSINLGIQSKYAHRTIESHDAEYKICQCKMIAPLLFWEELGNRLVN